jgi:hypothetical protein
MNEGSGGRNLGDWRLPARLRIGLEIIGLAFIVGGGGALVYVESFSGSGIAELGLAIQALSNIAIGSGILYIAHMSGRRRGDRQGVGSPKGDGITFPE